MIRWMGSILILSASLWAGFGGARRLRQTEEQLRGLSAALEQMACEVAYTNVRFHPLCAGLAERSAGRTAAFFRALGQAPLPGPGVTRQAAREAGLLLPEGAFRELELLLDSFGAYDLEGQLKLIRRTGEALRQAGTEIRSQLDGRCRTYEMLGLCTGGALLILVL